MNRYQDSPEDLSPDSPDSRFLGLVEAYMSYDAHIADRLKQEAMQNAEHQADLKASTDGGQAKTALKRKAQYNDKNSTKSVVGSK